MANSIIVVGAGRVGVAVASVLQESGHRVTLVDPAVERIEDARARVAGIVAVVGDGTDPAVLESAGIRAATALAAVSGSDETNLVAASLARYEFGVERCITRVVDPARSWLHTSAMGVDIALEQAELIARLVAEELSLGAMTRLVQLRQGSYELVERRVRSDAPAAGEPVASLDLPGDCLLVAIFRDGVPQLVGGGSVLEPGDEVLAVVRAGSAARLATLLGDGG